MNINMSFTFSLMLVTLGLFMLVYLIYGKTKRKSFLIGDYAPGKPGYDVFTKLVDNFNILLGTIIATTLAGVSLVFSTVSVLDSSSHSVFVVGPIMVAMTFILLFFILPIVFGRKH